MGPTIEKLHYRFQFPEFIAERTLGNDWHFHPSNSWQVQSLLMELSYLGDHLSQAPSRIAKKQVYNMYFRIPIPLEIPLEIPLPVAIFQFFKITWTIYNTTFDKAQNFEFKTLATRSVISSHSVESS